MRRLVRAVCHQSEHTQAGVPGCPRTSSFRRQPSASAQAWLWSLPDRSSRRCAPVEDDEFQPSIAPELHFCGADQVPPPGPAPAPATHHQHRPAAWRAPAEHRPPDQLPLFWAGETAAAPGSLL